MQDERGDIIGSWLVQLLLVMAVVGLVGYELLTVAVTALTLDGTADEVADAAAEAYEDTEDEDDALAAAEQEADETRTEVVELTVEDDWLHVTIVRPTSTLFVHRVPGLDGLADVAITRRSRWGP